MLLIITSTGDSLFRFININDLELIRPQRWAGVRACPPRRPEGKTLNNLELLKRGFSEFFRKFWMQRTFQH